MYCAGTKLGTGDTVAGGEKAMVGGVWNSVRDIETMKRQVTYW